MGEVFATSRSRGEAIGKMVNMKTMVICIAICTLAGMGLFGATFLLAPAAGTVSSGLGSLGITSMAVAIGIGAGAGAAMGLSYGIAYPPIFAGISKGVADLLGNKTVEGKSSFPPVKSAEDMQTEAKRHYVSFEQSKNTSDVRVIRSEALPSPEVSSITNFGELAPVALQARI